MKFTGNVSKIGDLCNLTDRHFILNEHQECFKPETEGGNL